MDNTLIVIILVAVGVIGLAVDAWMSRQPKRNQRLDVLYENWRLLPGDLEFDKDERNQSNQ